MSMFPKYLSIIIRETRLQNVQDISSTVFGQDSQQMIVELHLTGMSLWCAPLCKVQTYATAQQSSPAWRNFNPLQFLHQVNFAVYLGQKPSLIAPQTPDFPHFIIDEAGSGDVKITR